MLDLVPLAGAGRQVADHDVDAKFVGQLLQFAFPQLVTGEIKRRAGSLC